MECKFFGKAKTQLLEFKYSLGVGWECWPKNAQVRFFFHLIETSGKIPCPCGVDGKLQQTFCATMTDWEIGNPSDQWLNATSTYQMKERCPTTVSCSTDP